MEALMSVLSTIFWIFVILMAIEVWPKAKKGALPAFQEFLANLEKRGKNATKTKGSWRGKQYWKTKSRWQPKEEASASVAKIEERDDSEDLGEYEVAEFRDHVTRKNYLMTYTESRFFQGLQTYARERGLLVFTKVRLVDLFEVDARYYRKKQIFWKLVSKHVDFVIADAKGKVMRCIELDDKSHDIESRNDKIKNEIMEACGIELTRVKVAAEYRYEVIFGEGELQSEKFEMTTPRSKWEE